MAGGSAGDFGLLGIRGELELLDGRLEIENAQRKGSLFAIWVPVHPEALAARTATTSTPPHRGRSVSPPATCNIPIRPCLIPVYW